jgi:3-keto-5-aminohexanoate cleavage enzyme
MEMTDLKTDIWRYADSYDFMERTKRGMPPVILCCACNGGIKGRESNPAIPETADEIAESVGAAYDAGASIVHVHARNPNSLWRPETTVEGWWNVNAKIRERCPDIIINNTTGGGPDMTDEERMSCLEAKPEMASLNTSPDMSRFRLKERNAPFPHPHEAMVYDECLHLQDRLGCRLQLPGGGHAGHRAWEVCLTGITEYK